MSIVDIVCFAYCIIGIIVSLYNWKKHHQYSYNKARLTGEVENGMAVLYIISVAILWPIVLIRHSLK